MKLVTQIRYSIRILLDLAMHQSKEVVRIREISNRQHISLKYVEKLIYPLKKAGLIESKRGCNGGFYLALNSESITLAMIIRVFEKEKTKEVSKKLPEGYSGYQDALITEAWEEAKLAFYNRLEIVTLSQLSIDTTRMFWQDSDMLIL
jgi:Rrf2 family iron-sulfur cluster assembly transcriptional regulator